MVRSAEVLFAIEKMAAAAMGNKKIATSLALNSDRETSQRVKTQRETCHEHAFDTT